MSNVHSSERSVTAGTTSQHVLRMNPDRNYALLVNDDDTTIYLALGNEATSDSPIRLNANGGNYEINSTNLWKGAVSAYCSASKTLKVVEW